VNRFNIGDTVKRIKGHHNGMDVGHIDVVVGIDEMDPKNPCLSLEKYSHGHSIDNLIVVDAPNVVEVNLLRSTGNHPCGYEPWTDMIDGEPRQSGRTTAIILEGISRAMRNQGQWVYISDHYIHGGGAALNVFKNRLDEIIEQLGLKHIEITMNIGGKSLGIRSNIKATLQKKVVETWEKV
jgi:hypothetical protein